MVVKVSGGEGALGCKDACMIFFFFTINERHTNLMQAICKPKSVISKKYSIMLLSIIRLL